MGRFASGITVITTVVDGETVGMTANAFLSVSLEPPLVLVSVGKKAKMHEYLAKSGRYGISFLAEDQQAFSQQFAGRPQEGLQVPFIEKCGMPVLDGALAHIVATVVDAHPAGDHTLYIGQVEDLEYYDGNPLLFFSGKYRDLKSTDEMQHIEWQTNEPLFFYASHIG